MSETVFGDEKVSEISLDLESNKVLAHFERTQFETLEE